MGVSLSWWVYQDIWRTCFLNTSLASRCLTSRTTWPAWRRSRMVWTIWLKCLARRKSKMMKAAKGPLVIYQMSCCFLLKQLKNENDDLRSQHVGRVWINSIYIFPMSHPSNIQQKRYLRLKASLEPLVLKMDTSFASLGGHLTELKMDHRDGHLPSERLTALLDLTKNGSLKFAVY